jgi:RHS repeat-associated protein
MVKYNEMAMQTLSGLPTNMPVARVEFDYDYMSRRVGKTVYNWGSNDWQEVSSAVFLYDAWNLISEQTYEQTSAETNFLTFGLDLSGTLQGAGGIGGLVSAVLGTNAVCYTFDGNGNVSEVLDIGAGTPSSRILAHYEYSPFGETIVATGELAKSNPFRFSTKYTDDETSLVYYGFRFYSPSLGRFVSRDPVDELVDNESLSDPLLAELLVEYSFKTEIHPYHFVNNSPVQNTDLLGLKTCSHIDMYWECQCPSGSKKGKRQKDKKETNGCSYPGWLPQPPSGVDNPSGLSGCSFLPACDSHDCCYGSCGADKGPCDNAFLNDMKDICNSCAKTAADKKKCMKWAKRYHWGVDEFGGGPYEGNQKDNCEECCCD